MKLGWFVALAVSCMAATAGPAFAQDTGISGQATAIDADIIVFDGNKRVILWGIDAPDRGQQCFLNNDKYSCWDSSIRELTTLLTAGPVTCTYEGKPDRLGRNYGVCKIGDTNLNEEMVKGGYAMAFTDQSDEFVPAQDEAKAAGLELWQPGMKLVEPWKYRLSQHVPPGMR